MPLFIVKNNIVKMDVDAIVKPADSTPIGQGRTALRIHHAAGPELTGACLMLGNWPAGESRMTEGFQLRARHVAHTRVPAWDGGGENRWEQLASCYRTALELADREGCESVAVPLLSAELPGWPAERGLRTAMDTIAAFLNDHDMTVSLVVKDRESFQVDSGLAARLGRFVAENYRPDSRGIKDVIYDSLDEDAPRSPGFLGVGAVNAGVFGLFHKGRILEKLSSKLQDKLDDKLKHADEGFSEMLLRKIREQGR
ncbi:MAG: macro domain-containing protein, partial [Desulfovibrionaceae bacterium]|nr:macro domain-containing protein [Desulfovibrionaceae bacterium]